MSFPLADMVNKAPVAPVPKNIATNMNAPLFSLVVIYFLSFSYWFEITSGSEVGL